MQQRLKTKRSCRVQRIHPVSARQDGDVDVKQNLCSAPRGKTARGRKRDMILKRLTHDLMVFRRQSMVETEPSCPFSLFNA